MRRIVSLTAAICLAFTASAALAQEKAKWGYQGSAAAEHWGDLDPAFKTCKLGKFQSPIDIDTNKVERAALKPIAFAYKKEAAEVLNNGHSVQVNLPGASSATINGVKYKLLQFHFHAPSEEKFDGQTYPMDLHFVLQDAKGDLAAVGVLFKEGAENAALKPLFDALPAKEGDKKELAAFDPTALLPADRSYYKFVGSVTTPPCAEKVQWQVLKTPVEASAAQIEAFKKLYPMNARPVQPLNGRTIQVSK
jgi:carbonic anhydrase